MTTTSSTFPPLAKTGAFLRNVLLADALVSGATGALMAGAAGVLEPILQVPAPLLRIAGLALLPYAAFVAMLARRDVLPSGAVWAVVACNAIWAVDCVALLLTGWIDPTLLGVAFILMQAVVVAAFAELQVIGLRRHALASR
jgi:hypothetical protein